MNLREKWFQMSLVLISFVPDLHHDPKTKKRLNQTSLKSFQPKIILNYNISNPLIWTVLHESH